MDDLKARLDALRPLTREQLERLRPMWTAEGVRYVYATNALEGSTLTLSETQVVLEEGITVAGKPLKDHLDAVNGKHAWDFILGLIDERSPLSVRGLLSLHEIVAGPENTAWAGRVRDDARFISGSMWVPPSPERASEMLDAALATYAQRVTAEHPVRLAADLHFDIVHIHPFKDFNGRTARLAMNLHLMQHGFAPLSIMPTERAEYIEHLEAAHRGDRKGFLRFIERLEEREFKRYLHALEVAFDS